MKTKETVTCEQKVYAVTRKQGVFGCFEVTIGYYGNERVDYITYDTKGVWRCYEIKVSKSDFRSPAHKSFVGHFNYYVMPKSLYDEIAAEIPENIGCFVVSEFSCWCIKKPKRQALGVDEDILRNSMIRSLYRQADKLFKSDNPDYCERTDREIRDIKRERDDYRHKYYQARNDLYFVEQKTGINIRKLLDDAEEKFKESAAAPEE